MRILLTNDDSHDSPLFLMIIQMLQELGELTIVVPAQEQSWKGKSMTRFGELYVDRIDLHGTAAWSVSGTPADCVNLAIAKLLSCVILPIDFLVFLAYNSSRCADLLRATSI